MSPAKASRPQPMPEPTRCPKCGTLAAETVCHICGWDKIVGDRLVGYASVAIAVTCLATGILP